MPALTPSPIIRVAYRVRGQVRINGRAYITTTCGTDPDLNFVLHVLHRARAHPSWRRCVLQYQINGGRWHTIDAEAVQDHGPDEVINRNIEDRKTRRLFWIVCVGGTLTTWVILYALRTWFH